MKLIKLLSLLGVFYQSAFAQNFEGIYAGLLFSEKNVVVIHSTGSVITGTVLISKEEKFIFFGELKNSEITGTMGYAAKAWAFKGNLLGDSLLLSLAFDKETKQAFLKKVSSNPDKNTSGLVDNAARDQRLIGEWTLRKAENSDGSPQKIDEKMTGMTYVISSDGLLYLRIPSLYNKNPNHNFSPPKSKWSADGSNLTTPGELGGGTLAYEIKHDTLILKPKSGKSYWVRNR